MAYVLVVDDEPDIRETLRFALERDEHQVLEAEDGHQALLRVDAEDMDVIVLDLMMPNIDGFTVLEGLRKHEQARRTPVIVLTARGAEEDRIRALELGADDYISKPFSPKEVTLRVRNLLDRLQKASLAGELSYGNLTLSFYSMTLLVNGKEIDLTSTEFKLMRKLMQEGGKILSRDKLLSEVWGYRDTTMTRTLDTHIKRLREKLEEHTYIIETIRGIGYRLVSA